MYKIQVHTYGDPAGSWSGNAVEHDTQELAEDAAKDLFMRWTAVKWWRVIDENGHTVNTNCDDFSDQWQMGEDNNRHACGESP